MNKVSIFLAVSVCKVLHKLAGLVGRGSSLPGGITLRLFPDILSNIRMPDCVIAVTGSNGKTSTVEMIAHILKDRGRKVAWNRGGSNQIQGVATSLLCSCSAAGEVRADVVLIESDEQYARYTFRHFHPNYYIITNLYRDQLTRNGHPEWIYRKIAKSIYPDTCLILNADDPIVSSFGHEREGCLYYGIDHLASDTAENDSVYDDGVYCPVCGGRLEYAYHHYNHMGLYSCPSCGFRRPQTKWTATEIDAAAGSMTVNGRYRLLMPSVGIFQCYNALAALAAVQQAGVDLAEAADSLSSYHLQSGRTVSFDLGGQEGIMLTSKHENSVSYDQSIRVVASDRRESAVLFIVDAISRKYFTSDTSWLWDIDFEKLDVPQLRRVILAGRYCWDLRSRFRFTGIPAEKISCRESISEAVDELRETPAGIRYVITCFSDRHKFTGLSGVRVTGGI